MKICKIIFFIISIFLVSSAFARVDDYINEANLIKDMLRQSIETYKKGATVAGITLFGFVFLCLFFLREPT